MFVFSPIGLDDQIFSFIIEISNWNLAWLARFTSDGFQEENGLCAEFATDPSAADADEEGIDSHERFDEEIFHSIQSSQAQQIFNLLINLCHQVVFKMTNFSCHPLLINCAQLKD